MQEEVHQAAVNICLEKMMAGILLSLKNYFGRLPTS